MPVSEAQGLFELIAAVIIFSAAGYGVVDLADPSSWAVRLTAEPLLMSELQDAQITAERFPHRPTNLHALQRALCLVRAKEPPVYPLPLRERERLWAEAAETHPLSGQLIRRTLAAVGYYALVVCLISPVAFFTVAWVKLDPFADLFLPGSFTGLLVSAVMPALLSFIFFVLPHRARQAATLVQETKDRAAVTLDGDESGERYPFNRETPSA